eukprot:CAMPEP_0119397792 /NCGR_PEP_ID=MMETSP1334-20130426/140513_1 /TAXON_ID=127549 /ORGANISM="Calcidiscus leptoporus, Strain RCC1130" /LENGTH=100 /DNA_ID=CAMNT_0007421637 /DNA_START=1056 /DNA_END=1358 /DNA_ORIENTATION=-
MCFSTNHDLQNNSQDLLLGAPNALKPGMPVMRFLGSKSLTLGLMVRAFTSVTPGPQLRAPDSSFEIVGKAVSSGLAAVRRRASFHEMSTSNGLAKIEGVK